MRRGRAEEKIGLRQSTGTPGGAPAAVALVAEPAAAKPRSASGRRLRPCETDPYAKLKKLVKDAGLLERQPRYYLWKVPLTLALPIPGFVALTLTDSLGLQLLNAVYLAFAFAQIGFLGHDAGHRQICTTPPRNDRIGYVGVGIVGLSFSWWTATHNAHHTWPNQMVKDPAIEFDQVAFSAAQVRHRPPLYQWIIRWQGWYFPILVLLYPISMRRNAIRHFLAGKGKYPRFEMSLIVLHHLYFFGLIFAFLPFWTGVTFLVANQMIFALFLMSAFAPNHKGMPVLEEDEKMDFIVQQVITAQNVKGGALVDLWYGGLNYQIEHHLFPNMPRNRLRESAEIIRPYLEALDIPYTVVTPQRFYFDVLRYMHGVGVSARPSKRASRYSHLGAVPLPVPAPVVCEPEML